MKTRGSLFGAALGCCLTTFAALAAVPDPAFNPGAGANDTVFAVAVQPDGKILVGGKFTRFNDILRGRFARLHGDGTLDEPFSPTVGTMPLIEFDPNARRSFFEHEGTIEVNVRLYLYNGPWSVDYVIEEGTAKLGDDYLEPTSGTLSYTPGQTVPSIPITLVNDGWIEPNETFTVRLLNPVGAILGTNSETSITIRDNDFPINFHVWQPDNPEFRQFESAGEALILVHRDDDGTNTVTVDYATSDGTAQAGLDYTATSGTLVLPPGRGTTAFAVQLLPDCLPEPDETVLLRLENPSPGAVIGSRSNAVLRIIDSSRPGTMDASFLQYASFPQFYGSGRAVAVQPDGKILVLNEFTDTGIAYAARLHNDGSLDSSFNAAGVPPEFGGSVQRLVLLPNGKMIVMPTNNIIHRLHGDGSLDTSFAPDLQALRLFPSIHAVIAQPDGKLLLPSVLSGGDRSRKVILRMNEDGSLDETFDHSGSGVGEGFWFGSIRTTALQADGKILFGGQFTSYDGIPRRNLARLHPDGALDLDWAVDVAGEYAQVDTILVQPDGKIVIAGSFSSVNNTALSHLARLLPTGEIDAGFTPPDDLYPVLHVLQHSDGKRLVFMVNNGPEVIRLLPNGTRDPRFLVSLPSNFFQNWGFGWERRHALALQPDGNFLIGLIRFLSEPPLRLSAMFNGMERPVRLSLNTEPGVPYILQTSTNLFDWTPVSTNLASECTLQWTEAPEPNGPHRFYRAVRLESQDQ